MPCIGPLLSNVVGRSKKNWDHLVDETGNYYYIDPNNGIKGQQGAQGPIGNDGQKGEVGRQGPKGEQGEAGPVFLWKGSVPTAQDLPVAIRGTNGWTYQAEDTGFFHVSNGNRTYSVVENFDLIKGNQGDEGEKGATGRPGEKGEPGRDGFKGEVGNTGGPGQKGQKGEVEKGQKGALGTQGQKGQKGEVEKGPKGDPGPQGDDTFPEPPQNNSLYLRKYGSWVSSEKYSEPPDNGNLFLRKSGAWYKSAQFWPYDEKVGININAVTGVGNTNASNPNDHKYAFVVSTIAGDNGNSQQGWSSFFLYKSNHNIFTRGTLFVKSYAEGSGPGGTEVAVKANLRSMRSALRLAVSEAVDFDDLKAKLLTRLDSIEVELQDADPAEVPNDPIFD